MWSQAAERRRSLFLRVMFVFTFRLPSDDCEFRPPDCAHLDIFQIM